MQLLPNQIFLLPKNLKLLFFSNRDNQAQSTSFKAQAYCKRGGGRWCYIVQRFFYRGKINSVNCYKGLKNQTNNSHGVLRRKLLSLYMRICKLSIVFILFLKYWWTDATLFVNLFLEHTCIHKIIHPSFSLRSSKLFLIAVAQLIESSLGLPARDLNPGPAVQQASAPPTDLNCTLWAKLHPNELWCTLSLVILY